MMHQIPLISRLSNVCLECLSQLPDRHDSDTMATLLCILIPEFFCYDKNSDRSKCKLCTTTFNGRIAGNLQRHLLRHHKEQHKLFEEKSSARRNLKSSSIRKIDSVFKVQTHVATVTITEERLRSACVEMVTLNHRPFAMMNDSGNSLFLSMSCSTEFEFDRFVWCRLPEVTTTDDGRPENNNQQRNHRQNGYR